MSGMRVVPDSWLAGDPDMADAASWLRAHGYNMVALPVLDLLSLVARLEQMEKDPSSQSFLLDRVLTCDLPRLRQYLPDEALGELDR